MKHRMPEHCKGCIHLSTGGINDGKHNRWCCIVGRPAVRAIGHCKLNSLKRVGE